MTASNEHQAQSFRAQLAEREKAGFLPSRTHFAVIPDPDGKRIGSGGATLGVIRYIAQESGKNHGVFLRGEDGNVAKFLHKQSEETLRKLGAVNDRDCVDIDTGAILFSGDMLHSLYQLICTGGKVDENKYKQFVNDTIRLSLYGDFLYPLASDSTLEDYYKEKPEGIFCDQLTRARTALWQALRPYRMKLLRLAPAKFIHFGTTREILHLMNSGIADYKHLN